MVEHGKTLRATLFEDLGGSIPLENMWKHAVCVLRTYDGFHKWGTGEPSKWKIYNGKHPPKWMIWGHPHDLGNPHMGLKLGWGTG